MFRKSQCNNCNIYSTNIQFNDINTQAAERNIFSLKIFYFVRITAEQAASLGLDERPNFYVVVT